MIGKPRISPSAMETFERCGEQYRRAYVNRERIPPGVALLKGGAVHKAAEVNFRQKIDSHQDLPLPDVLDAAATEVDARASAEGVSLTPDEEAQGKAVVLGQVKDRAVALATLLHTQVAPQVQPALVEAYGVVPLPGRSHDLSGKLDVADVDHTIRDIKTAGKRKVQAEVDRSSQLTFYHVLYAHLTGHSAAGVTLDVLVDTKVPQVQHLTSSRTTRDREVFVARLNAMLAAIQAGNYHPAPVGHWCCSPRFCGYWWTCPYVNSERTAAAEAQGG